jgi:threonine dehydratase
LLPRPYLWKLSFAAKTNVSQGRTKGLPIPAPTGQQALTFDRVQAATARLAGIVHRTPLLTSRTLDARCGGTVCLKAEPFQRSGSFKFRGAYNRLSLLDADERRG